MTDEQIASIQYAAEWLSRSEDIGNRKHGERLRALLSASIADTAIKQEPLGAEFQKVLDDNLWNLYAADASIADTAGAKPDDVAVDKFAQAMKEKMAASRAKGRGGWETCAPEMLSKMLREHVEKGDPRDVANFCMMLWNNGAAIASMSAEPVLVRKGRTAKDDIYASMSAENRGASIADTAGASEELEKCAGCTARCTNDPPDCYASGGQNADTAGAIYQSRDHEEHDLWRDVPKATYDELVDDLRRIVYTATPAPSSDTAGAKPDAMTFDEWAAERFPAKCLSTKSDTREMDEAREFAREGWQAASAATPASSVADAAGAEPEPINLEGLRKKLLTPRKILRDDQGFLTHPDYPICDEGTCADKFLAAFGIETAFVAMESDLPDFAERYHEEGLSDCSAWTPTTPAGDGWILLEIYDTEDGPYAMFGRDAYEVELARKREHTRKLADAVRERRAAAIAKESAK